MEFKLLRFDKQKVLEKSLEDGLDMVNVLLLSTGEDKDVVQLYKHILVQHVSKYIIDQSLKNGEAEGWKGIMILDFVSLSLLQSMQGLSVLSFFSTKKNPTPAGEEEGQILPAATASLMYVSMASLSGVDREYRCPLGSAVPGCRSMAQSCGRCGGREVALAFLKISWKLWYLDGIPERSGAGLEQMEESGAAACFKQT